MSDAIPGNIPQLSDTQLQSAYEQLGIEFIGEQAILKLAEKAKIIIEKSALLAPSIDDLQKLRDKINSLLGNDIELFDPKNNSHEVNISGQRTREIGRVLLYRTIECEEFNCDFVNYYRYLTVEANSDVSDDGWIKIIQFILCVVAIIGLIAVLTLIPGGAVIVTNFATIAVVVVTGCTLLVSNIDKSNASLKAFTGK